MVIEGNGPARPFEYFIAIIDATGQVKASATATEPSAVAGVPPWVSVAGNGVYYIDGDAKLKRLTPDGATGTVATLPGGPNDRVMAAVDPESHQIAFAVAHLTPYQVTCPSPEAGPCPPPPAISTRLFLSNSDGSGARSLPGGEFPIAWRAGRIVLAPFVGFIQNRGEVNPYLTQKLSLLDPKTGLITPMSSPCSGDNNWLTGPLSEAGIACAHLGTSITSLDWTGHENVLAPLAGPLGTTAALGPDGRRAAVFKTSGELFLTTADVLTSLHLNAVPVGWIDEDHLLINTDWKEDSPRGLEVLDVATMTTLATDLAMRSGIAASYASYFATLPWD